MLIGKNKKISMTEGEFGIKLPITINGGEIASDETIKFYIINLDGMAVLIKKFTGIQNNTFDLSFTKEESKKLKAGCYSYKIDWYKENIFNGTIIENAIFKVKENCCKGILEEDEEEIVLNLQIKSAIPSKEEQSITYDEEFDALGEVIVKPIPEEYIKPEGTLEITTNGNYDVSKEAEVDVNVEMPTISDASYLFYQNARMDMVNEILKYCKPTQASYMFGNTPSNVEDIDLRALDVSELNSTERMFNGCKFSSVNMEGWNTNNILSTYSMYSNSKSLIKIDLSCFNGTKINNTGSMFSSCSALKTIIINNPNIFPMTSTNMLTNTPIANGTGYVYVPDDLVETYRQTTNWSQYANQIKGMSELPTEEV